jgi:hypothetical protein
MAQLSDWTGIIALIGAIGILGIFAVMDFYAVSACFSLAHTGISDSPLCAPEHIFRTALEIGGMAIGIYGVAKVVQR